MSSVSANSKELLPVAGKPVLHWVLEEGRAAGADRSVVVVSPNKADLMTFLAGHPEAEIAIQEEPNGLAPAVTGAAALAPVLVLLPDTLYFPASPAGRLVQALSRGCDIAIAIELVAEEKVSRYGIVEWNAESGRILRILEKPELKETSSRWAIAARFAISARTMLFLRQRVTELLGASREIDLPPLLNEAIALGHTALAIPLESNEQRLDCGNPEGYRLACEVVRI